MIVLGIFLLALALIGAASSALDPAERDSSATADALLFLLCLVGIIAAKHKRDSEDEF